MYTVDMNLCIMVKKKSYSEEKLNEMIVWLNNHANELTVESCIMQAKQCLGNYKMAGAFRLLQQIGENLENNK